MTTSVSHAQSVLEPYCIAAKLRALRVRKHLTLARLAAETGLSTALLSKLETDRMIPTLPTLATICRVYGVGLEHFFCDAGRHSLSITRRDHLMANTRGGATAVRIPLNALNEEPQLTAEMIEMAAGTAYTPEESGNGGCAFAYVLHGSLEMTSGGVVDTLATGDCAYLETEMHVSWTAKDEHCKVLVVRPGDGGGRG
ncbi:MAG: helix-turn-helix domain-containing protein [Acidobacteriota bacterium]